MPPPANDDFANAEVLPGLSGSTTGDTTSATTQVGEPPHIFASGTLGPTIWYSWTAPADGYEEFDLAGSSFDTIIQIFTGASLGALVQLAGNDDTFIQNAAFVSVQSRARLRVESGVTYYVRISGYGVSDTGSVVLAWSSFTPSNSYALTPAPQSVLFVDPKTYGYSGRWVINIPPLAGPFGGDGLTLRFHAPIAYPDGSGHRVILTLDLIDGADPSFLRDGFIFDSANPANFVEGWNPDSPGFAGYDYISAGNLHANTNDVSDGGTAYDLGISFTIDPASDPSWTTFAPTVTSATPTRPALGCTLSLHGTNLAIVTSVQTSLGEICSFRWDATLNVLQVELPDTLTEASPVDLVITNPSGTVHFSVNFLEAGSTYWLELGGGSVYRYTAGFDNPIDPSVVRDPSFADRYLFAARRNPAVYAEAQSYIMGTTTVQLADVDHIGYLPSDVDEQWDDLTFAFLMYDSSVSLLFNPWPTLIHSVTVGGTTFALFQNGPGLESVSGAHTWSFTGITHSALLMVINFRGAEFDTYGVSAVTASSVTAPSITPAGSDGFEVVCWMEQIAAVSFMDDGGSGYPNYEFVYAEYPDATLDSAGTLDARALPAPGAQPAVTATSFAGSAPMVGWSLLVKPQPLLAPGCSVSYVTAAHDFTSPFENGPFMGYRIDNAHLATGAVAVCSISPTNHYGVVVWARDRAFPKISDVACQLIATQNGGGTIGEPQHLAGNVNSGVVTPLIAPIGELRVFVTTAETLSGRFNVYGVSSVDGTLTRWVTDNDFPFSAISRLPTEVVPIDDERVLMITTRCVAVVHVDPVGFVGFSNVLTFFAPVGPIKVTMIDSTHFYLLNTQAGIATLYLIELTPGAPSADVLTILSTTTCSPEDGNGMTNLLDLLLLPGTRLPFNTGYDLSGPVAPVLFVSSVAGLRGLNPADGLISPNFGPLYDRWVSSPNGVAAGLYVATDFGTNPSLHFVEHDFTYQVVICTPFETSTPGLKWGWTL